MKLAEALIKRRDIDTAISNLNLCLEENIKVIEGVKPFENPDEIIATMCKLIDEQTELVQKINAVNSTTVTEDGKTLNELLTVREQLKRRHKILDKAYKYAYRNGRYDETKFVITADMKNLKNKIAESAKDFRNLDNRIQAINWSTEFI